MYEIVLDYSCDKSLRKLQKKNPVLFEQVRLKLMEISADPKRFKPLRNVWVGYRRTHVGKFVLIFKIDAMTVRLVRFDHHDHAY